MNDLYTGLGLFLVLLGVAAIVLAAGASRYWRKKAENERYRDQEEAKRKSKQS